MMAELKAGGLAIFVAGPADCIGITVETIKLIMPGESYVLPKCRMKNAGSSRWLIKSDRISTYLPSGSVIPDFSLAKPHWLMPIDGEDFLHEDQQQKELTHG